MRNFIVNYRNFTPISEALSACGLQVHENLLEPDDETLADCAGFLYCMYDAIKNPLQLWRLRTRLHRFKVPLITWNRDGPHNKGEKAWRIWLLKTIPYFDLYASHTMQDSSDFAPQAIYLPNAAWSTEYKLAGVTLAELRDPSRYQHDVSFFGRLDASQYPEMREREGFLRELQSRLSGHGVRCAFVHAERMPIAEQVNFIQRSRINLNVGSGADERGKSWGLPERCYGVQACGGFLLSDSRRHAVDDFEPGREWVEFEAIDDCVDKIRHYLAHFDSARDIAEAAYRRVMRDHTYRNRALTLLDAAEQCRAKLGAR